MAKVLSKSIATLNAGEQDPALLGRWDTAAFFKGAAKLRNCYSLVTGGIVRRPGLEYIAELGGAEPLTNRHTRFIPYLDGGTDSDGVPTGALIIISFDQIIVYDVPAMTVAATFVDSTYNGRTNRITWTQKTGGDDIIIFHGSLRPRRLSIATGTWLLTTLSLDSIPQYHFVDTAGSATSHVERLKFINFDGSGSGDRFTMFIDGVETDWITFVPSGATVATNIKTAIEALPNITAGDVTVAVITGNTLFTVTLAGSVNGRRFLFTAGQFDEQNDATLNNVLSFTTDFKGSLPKEDVWSGTVGTGGPGDRGWPRCGVFFGNRLYMAGTVARSNTVWGSRFGNAEDFITLDDPTDDSPIEASTDAQIGATFNGAFAGRHLQFFASNNEFYVPASDFEPLTPSNFTLRVSSAVGILRGSPLIFLEGATIFFQRDGRGLRRHIFTEAEQNYRSPLLSVRGGHLLDVPFDSTGFNDVQRNPVTEMALQRSRDTKNPDRLYLINGAGNLICITVSDDEGVLAWHQWETQGLFTNLAVVGDQVFVGVLRTDSLSQPAASPDAHHLERFDSRLLVDAATFDFSISPPVADSGVLAYLDPGSGTNTVEAIVDGVSQGTTDLTNSKQTVDFTPAAQTEWQVGLQFPDVKGDGSQVWIRTLPLEFEELEKITMGDKKRIVTAILRLLDTGHIEVGGKELSLLAWIEAGDLSLHRKTGDFKREGLNVIDGFGQIDITQSKSEHLHLLGIRLDAELVGD